MAKQTVNVGVTDNDGTGSTIRAGGQIINSNFTEVYSTLGDGSTITFDLSGATNGQALVYNSSTGKFEPGTAAVSSDFIISGDGGADQTISTGDTLNVQGGTGISTTGVATDTLTVAIDSTVATLTGSQVLTGKTIDTASNTITVVEADISDLGSYITATSSDVLQNKSIAAGSNTITGLTNTNLSGTAAITNANLANSSITIRDDSSTEDAVSLGETLIVTGAGGLTTSVSGNTLTLTQASASLTYSKGTATGDGSTTAFTINSGRAEDDILVFVNGICLVPTDDYTISGTTLTFNTAPAFQQK
jgi:hypothetical protein